MTWAAVATYPREQLYQEIAYIASHFHWSLDDILDMEHEERHVWLREIARVNREINEARAHGMLAKLYSDIAESDKAIFHAKKVVELEPDDAFSYTALSVVYQRCGRIPEAEHAKAIAWNTREACSSGF